MSFGGNPFKDWVLSKVSEESPRGDFARDVQADDRFPSWSAPVEIILIHLRERYASDEAMEVFFDLWRDFSESDGDEARKFYNHLVDGSSGEEIAYDRKAVDHAQPHPDEAVVWSGTVFIGRWVANLFVFNSRVMVVLGGKVSSASFGSHLRSADRLARLLIMCAYDCIYRIMPEVDHVIGAESMFLIQKKIAETQQTPDALIFKEEDGLAHIICPFCHSEHWHSPGEGHRSPHCSGVGNPWALQYRLVYGEPGRKWVSRP